MFTERPIFEKIAKRLEAEGGLICSHTQISEKLKELKKAYKKVKDNNNLFGRSRKTFKHFDEMDQIMGDKPITRPPSLFESSEQASIESNSDNEISNGVLEEPDFDDDIERSPSTPSPASSSATPHLPMPTTISNDTVTSDSKQGENPVFTNRKK